MPNSPYYYPRISSIRLFLLVSAIIPLVYYTFSQWRIYRSTELSERKRIRYIRKSNSFNDLSSYLYSLFDEYSGGPLYNASIRGCIKLGNSHILFASGGWNGLIPSLLPIPMYTTRDIQLKSQPKDYLLNSHLYHHHHNTTINNNTTNNNNNNSTNNNTNGYIYYRIDDLENYWMTKSIGKSLIFNGSAVFIMAIQALKENQNNNIRNNNNNNQHKLLHYHNRRYLITNFEFCIGQWMNNYSRPIIKFLFEAGELSQIRRDKFIENYHREPKLNTQDLSLICQFGGPMKSIEFVKRYQFLPTTQFLNGTDMINQSKRMELQGILMDIKEFQFESTKKKYRSSGSGGGGEDENGRDFNDYWIKLQVIAEDDNDIDNKGDEKKIEYFHVNLSAAENHQFQGFLAGDQPMAPDSEFKPPAANKNELELKDGESGSSSDSHHNGGSSLFDMIEMAMNKREPMKPTLYYARPNDSAFESTLRAPVPNPVILSESEFIAQGGRIQLALKSPQSIIEFIQNTILLNNESINPNFIQMSSILHESIQQLKLNDQWMKNRIPATIEMKNEKENNNNNNKKNNRHR